MQIFERFDIFVNELHVTLFGLNVHLLKSSFSVLAAMAAYAPYDGLNNFSLMTFCYPFLAHGNYFFSLSLLLSASYLSS